MKSKDTVTIIKFQRKGKDWCIECQEYVKDFGKHCEEKHDIKDYIIKSSN